jgi:hypothetical protein
VLPQHIKHAYFSTVALKLHKHKSPSTQHVQTTCELEKRNSTATLSQSRLPRYWARINTSAGGEHSSSRLAGVALRLVGWLACRSRLCLKCYRIALLFLKIRRNLREGGGANSPPLIIFVPKNSFLSWRGAKKYWGRVGERGVCILRPGSKQSSP